MASLLQRSKTLTRILCVLIVTYGICYLFVYFGNGSPRFPEQKLETHLESKTCCSKIVPRNFILEQRVFPKIPECRNFTTKLYFKSTFNLTALVSYPGSGNTWLRHLIEMGTGVFTGSVYFDASLFARGFLGEREDWNSGSTIVQKLHLNYNEIYGFKRSILLIREPISAIHSFVEYLESGHTGWASPTTFLRKEWPRYMLHSTFNWITLTKSWLQSPVEVLVIHYENLWQAPNKEINKICQFLNVDCSRMELACFQNNTEGLFHRRKPFWKTKMYLPQDMLKSVDDGIDYLNQILIKYGHEPLPLSKYRYYRNTTIGGFKII